MLKENILKELHVWIKNRHRLPNASRRNLRSKQRIILSPMPNKHPVVVYIAVKWRWHLQRDALSQTSSQCPIIIIVCNIKLLTLISLKLYVKHRGCCSFFKLCASFFAAQWIYRQIQFFTSRCRLALTILIHLIISYTEYHYLKCILNFLSCLAEGETYQTNSPLQIIESFLEALTNADKDGRIVVNKQGVKKQ